MIPLMNLTRQYESIQDKLDVAALRVLHSGQYIMGEKVIEFEKEFADYIGVKYAVGVGNGTYALTIALKAVGVTAGDEVITSAMSFFATAEAIVAIGAIPVFVDCTLDIRKGICLMLNIWQTMSLRFQCFWILQSRKLIRL